MSNLGKGIILIVVILAIGAGLIVWKNRVAGHSTVALNSITKEEIEMLLADVAKVNPMIPKRLKEDPEEKKRQLDQLKQLLAFASQAKQEGLADTDINRRELESIRAEVVAVSYDREINKDKGPMPPFGFITEDQVKAYWGEDAQEPAEKGFFASMLDKIGLSGTAAQRKHETEFEQFLDAKLQIMKEGNPQMKDREISEEEKTQAKEFFAKVQIYKKEYDDKVKSGELSKEFIDKVNLQLKLQQAQFLAGIYSKDLAEKIKVTDEEVAKYIAEHPEFSTTEKRAKAEEILNRVKAGEDFATLAKEFTEDPGSKEKGGLYESVPKGQMVAPFEEAALALESGQVSPELVETDFGFHIIKLEKKNPPKEGDAAAAETYDVRHILIGTGVKDPEDPMSREMPAKQLVRQKLEKDKQKNFIDQIVAANHVQVPEDFDVPEVTDEQLQEMQKRQQQQQQMQQPPMTMDDGTGPKGKDKGKKKK